MSRAPTSPSLTGCRRVPLEDPSLRDNSKLFALLVQDNAMAAAHIIAGDVLICEHGLEPRSGDVVAAYLDNESIVRTYVSQNGRPFLKAAPDDHTSMISAQELVIQGVMVKLIRERR